MLAHVPSFGRNPRGSPDFLAYPVSKACMYVLGTDAFLWGAWSRDAAVTRTSKQAGKALRSQGHQYARVM